MNIEISNDEKYTDKSEFREINKNKYKLLIKLYIMIFR